MFDPSQPLITPAGLRLDPTGPLGTLADAWEGGIHRIVAFRGGGQVLLLTLGYGAVTRTFATIDDALAAIDAEAGDAADVFPEVAHG